MGNWMDYFFLSDDLDIIRFTVWHLMYFAVFTGTWIPIWRQSEIREPRRKGNQIVQTVIKYGYQTRKRREKQLKLWPRWILMNPDYFYNSILWSIIVLSAATGCYYAQTDGEENDIRAVALWLAGLQAGFFGMWTIAPFYWDMPGWGVLHLVFSSLMSVAVSWLYGYLNWWAFGIYSAYTGAQILLAVIYGVAFLGALETRRIDGKTFQVGNPLRALFMEGGLHPISFLERDLYLPSLAQTTKRR